MYTRWTRAAVTSSAAHRTAVRCCMPTAIMGPSDVGAAVERCAGRGGGLAGGGVRSPTHAHVHLARTRTRAHSTAATSRIRYGDSDCERGQDPGHDNVNARTDRDSVASARCQEDTHYLPTRGVRWWSCNRRRVSAHVLLR